MSNPLRTLSSNNLNEPISEKKKNSRIRENTVMFNMILNHLASEYGKSNFKNPYNVSSFTQRMYLKHAKCLHELGVTSVKSYEAKQAQIILSLVDDIPKIYLPKKKREIESSSDWCEVVHEISSIKSALNRTTLDEDGRFTFSKKSFSLNNLIYAFAAIIKIHKLTLLDDQLIQFLIKSSDLDMKNKLQEYHQTYKVDIHTSKESGLNRKHIYAIKTLIASAIDIQLNYFQSDNETLTAIDVKDPTWIDRILSAALEI